MGRIVRITLDEKEGEKKKEPYEELKMQQSPLVTSEETAVGRAVNRTL